MKSHELDTILKLLKQGLTKKKIRKKLNLSTTSLSNRLREMEDKGFILRRGKYQTDILPSSSKHPRVTRILTDKKLNKRGHAFNFKILFPSETNLKEKPLVINFLSKKQRRKPKILRFGSISFKYKNNTVWINKESLTVYCNASYYSQDAYHAKFSALRDVDNLVKNLKQKFGFKGLYGIEIFREHYGLIFNQFAEWILSRGGKLNVKNKKNKSILWVDDSREDDIGLKEFESDSPGRITKAHNYFESLENLGWIDPKETEMRIRKLSEQNLQLTQVLEQVSNNLIRLTKEFTKFTTK